MSSNTNGTFFPCKSKVQVQATLDAYILPIKTNSKNAKSMNSMWQVHSYFYSLVSRDNCLVVINAQYQDYQYGHSRWD